MTADQERSLRLAKGLALTPANLARVARETSDDLARWAFGQWHLRARAAARFPEADRMLWDVDGLEMASHPVVAAWRAGLFPPGERVADLTAGIGSDLIALAARGPAVGFERDPARAASAAHNAGVPVVVGDVLEADWDFRFAVADPARREGGQRVRRLTEFSPDPVALAARMAALELGLIKLTPMLSDEELASLGPEVRFVSYGRECREALVGVGSRAGQGVSAVHVESGESLPAGLPAPTTDELADWFYDADPAAVRAHALGPLAERRGLRLLDGSGGYLVGASRVESPWLARYRVLGELPLDSKRLRATLRERRWRPFELKQRGAGLDGPAFLKSLKVAEGDPVSLAAWRSGPRVRLAALVLDLPRDDVLDVLDPRGGPGGVEAHP